METLQELLIVDCTEVTAPSTLLPTTIYIKRDTGKIHYQGKTWFAGGGIGNFQTRLSSVGGGVSVILDVTLSDGTLQSFTLFSLKVSDTFVFSTGVPLPGDPPNTEITPSVAFSGYTGNIVGNRQGVWATVRQTYNAATGSLKLQYTNDGTNWIDLSDINMPLDSSIVNAKFCKKQSDWDNSTFYTQFGETADPIAEPSLVLVISQGTTPPSFVNVVVPAADIFYASIVDNTDGTIDVQTSTDGTEITFTIGVAINNTSKSAKLEATSIGLKAMAMMTVLS